MSDLPAPKRAFPLDLAPEVADALGSGCGVVALESTIIAHGLPRPQNRELASAMEDAVRSEGAIPATCAVLDGRAKVGLDAAALDHFANTDGIAKLSARDLAVATATAATGATTVAGTIALAAAAGISVMATGGLGGVHRGAKRTFDVSADLLALRTYPVAVVAAGVKSVLDIGATLEVLETLGVPVVGWRTRAFPAFYVARSGFELDWAVWSTEQAARLVRAELAAPGGGGLLLANPVDAEHQLDPDLHDRALAEALRRLDAAGVRGKAVTPALLADFQAATGGKSVEVNVRLALANARLAGAIAAELARQRAAETS